MIAAPICLRRPAIMPGGRLRHLAAALACLLMGVLAGPAGAQDARRSPPTAA
jgi:hypothetical protein